MNIQEAMKIVITEIANDPSYRVTWEANIAMAFKDQVMRETDFYDPEWLHNVSNKAANNFLDILVMPLKINR